MGNPVRGNGSSLRCVREKRLKGTILENEKNTMFNHTYIYMYNYKLIFPINSYYQNQQKQTYLHLVCCQI